MERAPSIATRHYLVELSTTDGSWSDLADLTVRARAAVARAREQGNEIAFVRSVYAPESNRLFLVYRAATDEAVIAAAHDAELRPGSVSAAIEASDGGRR